MKTKWMIERKNAKPKQVKNKQKQRPFIGFSRGLLSLSCEWNGNCSLNTCDCRVFASRSLKKIWFVCRLTFDICWRCCSCVTGKQSVIRVCVSVRLFIAFCVFRLRSPALTKQKEQQIKCVWELSSHHFLHSDVAVTVNNTVSN